MSNLISAIEKIITIPIPKQRVYESPEKRNGYDNQIISTDNLGYDTLYGEFAGYSRDMYGNVYLRYVMDAIEFDINFSGMEGFTNFPGELHRICQLLKQDGIHHVRSIKKEDFYTKILRVYKRYWVDCITISSINNPDNHIYSVYYSEDNATRSAILYDEEYDQSFDCGPLGVRPVIYLPLPDRVYRQEVFNLVDELFDTWK